MAFDRFLKNQIRDTSPQSLKMLNDTFDYLYQHLNETLDVNNVSSIDFINPDIFDIIYENTLTETYYVSRNTEGFIDNLSDGTLDISITR